MKIINLKTLELKNFKGIKNKEIKFGEKTNIAADNGVGKSTIMDSFMWLLFDKDSSDRKNFDIKPFNVDGSIKHGLESKVKGILEIDGSLITLEKTYKEKWTKKSGEADKKFSGHETIYSIDDIPTKKKDYEEKIKEICEEKLFKLVTNPNYFASLNWKEQREIIQAIIGQIDDDKVINYNSNLEMLRTQEFDSVENHRIRTQGTIKKLKEQLKQIPFRIDELESSKEEINVQELENEREKVKLEIEKIDEVLQDSSKGNEILLEHKQRLFDLKNEYQEKENHAKLLLNKPLEHFKKDLSNKKYEVQNLAFEKKDIERNIVREESCIKELNENIKTNESKLENLRNEYRSVQKEEFELDINYTKCPTCNRELENSEEIIKDFEEKFNFKKANRLKNINAVGKKLSLENEDTKNKIEEVNNTLAELKEKLEKNNVQKSKVEQEIKDFESKINNFIPKEIEFVGKAELENEIKMAKGDIDSFKLDDNSELKEKKRNLVDDLEGINKKIALFENNKKIDERIEELGEEERNISINIAKYEKTLFLCEEFIRTKVELSEGLINKKFKNIKFKLFNELINGGLEECCEIVIDGVPYSNANSASKINAGIEVINTLTDFYGVQAVIFIDNAESINEIAETNSQIVRLIVSKDKELKVEIE
ncbi:MAG: AAA family ATPase [Cetobacterium sp.]